jgi:hypothetical protein
VVTLITDFALILFNIMYSGTVSVPFAIREVLSSNPLYFQAIQFGIANYTALAQRIRPEVEKITATQVNIGTIVVAIKRFADILQKEQRKEDNMMGNKKVHFGEGTRMSLTGSIIDVDFDDRDFEQLSNILDEMFEKDGRSSPFYYNLFQTNKQLRLFAEDVQEIRNILSLASQKFDGRMRAGLSKITITLPSSASTRSAEGPQRNPYNLLSIVSDVLYKNQIILHDAFFTPNEIVLILNEKDAARAYELLRAKIVTKGQ